jgi:hypothetical protein
MLAFIEGGKNWSNSEKKPLEERELVGCSKSSIFNLP